VVSGFFFLLLSGFGKGEKREGERREESALGGSLAKKECAPGFCYDVSGAERPELGCQLRLMNSA